MDVEVWIVYLRLILIIIMLVLMKQNPDVEEARKKERKSKLSLPPSSSPGNVGKQLEYIQEELDKFLEKLNHVVFDTEARKRDGHHDQKSIAEILMLCQKLRNTQERRVPDWTGLWEAGVKDTHFTGLSSGKERDSCCWASAAGSAHPSLPVCQGERREDSLLGLQILDCTPLHLQLPECHGDSRDRLCMPSPPSASGKATTAGASSLS